MIRHSLFGLVITLTACLLAAGDQSPPTKSDPQSTFEPRSAPGAGQKFLKQFVGNWDVVKTFYPRSGDPIRTKGECQQAIIHGDRFLKSEFLFGEGKSQTTGTGIIGFEAESGLFTSVWTDSRTTGMSLRQSKDKFNGEEIVLYSKSLKEGKESRQSRTVTRLEDAGRKIVHRQFVAGADEKERLIMELVMMHKAEERRPPK